MPVCKREYISDKTKKPVWGYAFTYRKCRFRRAGYYTKAEAELAEQKRRHEVIIDAKVLNPKNYGTFSVVADECMKYRASTCAESTVKAEQGHLVIINKHFEGMRIDKIQPADIHAFIRKRKADDIGNRTVNIELNLMRNVFFYALQHQQILYSPMQTIKNLKEVVKDRECLSKDEFIRLTEATRKLPNSIQLLTWISTSAYTGLRPSEVIYLEWKDIYFDQDKIYVRPKNGNPLKTGKFRVVPLNPELKPILLTWKTEWDNIKGQSGHNHDWVFIYPADPTKRSQGFRKSFTHACRDAKVVPKSRYEFRHFFISQSIMQGIDLLTIATWVGHSSPQMIYKHYGHLSPSWQGEQMNRLSLLSRPVEAVA